MKINKNYTNWILENASLDRQKEIKEAVYRMKSAIMWININMPFYAEIIVNVAVFGSYSNPTMWTDCKTFIAYNPKFVCERSDEEVRFTIIHEALHIIMQHDTRKGGRNHDLWNIATDYAINGIIASDQKFKEGKLAVPTWRYDRPELKIKKGEQCVYLDQARFEGMPAEDIYDKLLEDGWKLTEKDKLIIEEGGDIDTSEPEIEPGTVAQEGPYEEEYFDEFDIPIPVRLPDDQTSDPRQGNNNGDEGRDPQGDAIPPGMDPQGDAIPPGMDPQGDAIPPGATASNQAQGGEAQGGEADSKGKGQIVYVPKPGKVTFRKETEEQEDIAIGGMPGDKTSRDNNIGDAHKDKAKEWKRAGKSRILRKTNWDSIKRSAFSRHQSSMTSATRKGLLANFGDKPSVDWETELKKWYDYCLTGRDYVIPNRRLLASGTILYGSKPAGTSGLKIIVAAVDTSGSISEDQKKTFLNEVAYLAKKHNSDKLIIIYCSDDIDGVQVIKKGEKIDLSIMASTGGNAKGFVPPFQWLWEKNIKPSVFIYLTDTGGLMPNIKEFNIARYSKKVIWFICSTSIYNTPPFGKCIFMPVHSIKDKVKKGKETTKL